MGPSGITDEDKTPQVLPRRPWETVQARTSETQDGKKKDENEREKEEAEGQHPNVEADASEAEARGLALTASGGLASNNITLLPMGVIYTYNWNTDTERNFTAADMTFVDSEWEHSWGADFAKE